MCYFAAVSFCEIFFKSAEGGIISEAYLGDIFTCSQYTRQPCFVDGFSPTFLPDGERWSA